MRFEPDLALVETVEGDWMEPPALELRRTEVHAPKTFEKMLYESRRKDRDRYTVLQGSWRVRHAAEPSTAPDCLQPPLVPRYGFRQQVSASVRRQNYCSTFPLPRN
jgi:hypothetical protein